MSSLLPNRSDGYQVTVNFTLSPAVWNAAFGDVALRLDDIEAVVAAGYAAAQEAGTAMAEAIIENAVSDQLDQIGQRIGDYNEQLDLAEDQLAALQQGGVEAINITIPNYGIYENVNAQGAFYELSDYIDSISGALDGPEAFTFSFAGGLTVNWASESDAIGGVNASRPMTPLRTAQAIAALAGDVVKEVFTASGTFTKEDDDFAYFVELWGGGGGGYGYENAADASAPGGGGGEYCSFWITAPDLPDNASFVIGAGGVGGFGTTQPNRSGTDGGNTSFQGVVAKGGKSPPSDNVGGDGGAGQRGGISSATRPVGGYAAAGGGTTAGTATTVESYMVRNGANTTMGGGGGGGAAGSTSQPLFGDGGLSKFGGNGGMGSSNGNASPGQIPGGGGGGAGRSGKGGNGARGEVRITRFKRVKQ